MHFSFKCTSLSNKFYVIYPARSKKQLFVRCSNCPDVYVTSLICSCGKYGCFQMYRWLQGRPAVKLYKYTLLRIAGYQLKIYIISQDYTHVYIL